MSSPAPYWRDPDWRDEDWLGSGRHEAEWRDPRRRGAWREPGWRGEWHESGWRGHDRQHPADGESGRRRPLRIGDAERDRAVAILGDHFVAGRLTQTEFEERSEQATRARYAGDLEPLFDDLPDPAELDIAAAAWSPPTARPRRRGPLPPPFVLLAPILMIGLIVTAVTLTAPWILWGLFWIALVSSVQRRRWQYQHRHRH